MKGEHLVHRGLSCVLGLLLLGAGACSPAAGDSTVSPGRSAEPAREASPTVDPNALPGMPPLLDPNDIYAADRPGALSRAVRHDLNLVYIPNNASNTVSVIDPVTRRVIRTVSVPT